VVVGRRQVRVRQSRWREVVGGVRRGVCALPPHVLRRLFLHVRSSCLRPTAAWGGPALAAPSHEAVRHRRLLHVKSCTRDGDSSAGMLRSAWFGPRRTSAPGEWRAGSVGVRVHVLSGAPNPQDVHDMRTVDIRITPTSGPPSVHNWECYVRRAVRA